VIKIVKYSRVYAKRIKGALTSLGSALLVASLFFYLSSIGAITITGYSGDMVCNGTVEDPCYAYINFTTNRDIFIYPSKEWLFSTEPNVKEVILQRKWGDSWRTIDLTKPCNGAWCGCYWCNKNHTAKFAYVFRAGRDYQIRIVGYKYNPYQNVKWSFGPVDPWWNSNWQYCRNVTLTSSLLNATYMVELTSSNFDFTHANSDGSDIRIVNAPCNSGGTELPFWIEDWNHFAEHAVVWFKADKTSSSPVIYSIYYGNPSVGSGSDIYSTFCAASDFEVDPSTKGWAMTPLSTTSHFYYHSLGYCSNNNVFFRVKQKMTDYSVTGSQHRYTCSYALDVDEDTDSKYYYTQYTFKPGNYFNADDTNQKPASYIVAKDTTGTADKSSYKLGNITINNWYISSIYVQKDTLAKTITWDTSYSQKYYDELSSDLVIDTPQYVGFTLYHDDETSNNVGEATWDSTNKVLKIYVARFTSTDDSYMNWTVDWVIAGIWDTNEPSISVSSEQSQSGGDTNPPTQSNWNPANESTLTSTSFTLTFTLDEEGDCRWSTTDTDYDSMTNDCTGDGTTSISCSISGLSEGTNHIYTACCDTNGNCDDSTSNTNLVYYVDLGPPTVSYVSPTDENVVVDRKWAFVNVTASDKISNIDSCILHFNGTDYTMNKVGSGTAVSAWYNVTNLDNGNYTYNVTCTDIAGYVGKADNRWVYINYTFIISISVDYPADGYVETNDKYVNFSVNCDATNGVSLIELYTNESGYWHVYETSTTSSWTFKHYFVRDGKNYWKIKCTDAEGQSNETDIYTIDIQVPFPDVDVNDPYMYTHHISVEDAGLSPEFDFGGGTGSATGGWGLFTIVPDATDPDIGYVFYFDQTLRTDVTHICIRPFNISSGKLEWVADKYCFPNDASTGYRVCQSWTSPSDYFENHISLSADIDAYNHTIFTFGGHYTSDCPLSFVRSTVVVNLSNWNLSSTWPRAITVHTGSSGAYHILKALNKTMLAISDNRVNYYDMSVHWSTDNGTTWNYRDYLSGEAYGRRDFFYDSVNHKWIHMAAFVHGQGGSWPTSRPQPIRFFWATIEDFINNNGGRSSNQTYFGTPVYSFEIDDSDIIEMDTITECNFMGGHIALDEPKGLAHYPTFLILCTDWDYSNSVPNGPAKLVYKQMGSQSDWTVLNITPFKAVGIIVRKLHDDNWMFLVVDEYNRLLYAVTKDYTNLSTYDWKIYTGTIPDRDTYDNAHSFRWAGIMNYDINQNVTYVLANLMMYGSSGYMRSKYIMVDAIDDRVTPTPESNFMVYDGSDWSYDFDNNPIFICGENTPVSPGQACTDSYVAPEYQSDAQAIFKLTNDGGASGTGKLRINATVSSISIFCDDDNTYDGAVTLTTTYQDICGIIDPSQTCYIWCWANFTSFSPPAEPIEIQATIE